MFLSWFIFYFLQLYYNILPKVTRNDQTYVALRLNPLAEITGNLSMESQIRETLKQLYKKSYRGLQYFLDPQSPLPYTYPIRTKEENNTKSCKCVFIGHRHLQCNTLEKLHSGYT